MPTRFTVSVENVATPATAFTVVVPPSVAPPGLAPNVTLTGPVKAVVVMLWASLTVRTIGASVAPAVVDAGCVVSTTRIGMAAVPVAPNVTGEPLRPAALAVTVCAPTIEPSVHAVCATPLASVTALAVATDPPPEATAKLTFTPPTPTPSLALTFATSGCGSSVPTVALWASPDCAAIAAARSSTSTFTASVGPVSSCATMRAVPRELSAAPAPALGEVIVARAGSSDAQMMGVPGMVVPPASVATAVKVKPSPSSTVRDRGEITTRAASAPGPV